MHALRSPQQAETAFIRKIFVSRPVGGSRPGHTLLGEMERQGDETCDSREQIMHILRREHNFEPVVRKDDMNNVSAY